ncbi:hypothetical protein ART_2275 [Arthrobacter sp. PAMC 25486]|nr:hypothetical protein [Arthrobacter sp. PAMC 25486]AIY01874.1 hypothetical protein ART_2275 [Arthrobacter sp. PAMC 25486]
MVDKLNPTPDSDSDSDNTVIPHDHYRFLDSLKAQGGQRRCRPAGASIPN